MKKITCWIGMAVLLCLTACSGKKDYERVLPEDAALIAAFDLRSVATKSGLAGETGQPAVGRLADLLKSGMEGSDGLIDNIISDPQESGLSFTDKAYFFAGARAAFAGLLMHTVDEGKLTGLLEKLEELHVCEPLREGDGCTWTVMGKVLVAYNDDAFVAVMNSGGRNPDDMQHMVAMWLRQERERSFAATADFASMQEAESDVAVFASLALFPERTIRPLTMGISAALKPEDVKVLAAVRFEPGRLSADIRSFTTDKVMQEMVSRYLEATSPVAGSYLDVFPANTPGWATARVDGSQLYRLLNRHPAVRHRFEHSIMPLDFRAIFSAVKGDVSFTVTNPLYGEFIAHADVTGTSFLQTIESLKPMIALTGGQMRLTDRGENAYEFYAMDGSALDMRPGPLRVWFGVKEGRLYLTNREDLIDRNVLGLSLRDTEWGKTVKGKRLFASLNFATLMELVSPSLNKDMEIPPLFVGLDKMDRLTVSMGEDRQVQIELMCKDRTKNILEQMLALVNLSASE